MTKKFNLEQIRDYWEQQALQHGQSHVASWSDKLAIEMEIREIIEYLADDDSVLDIGCANGYSTIQFASQKRIDICGVDYIPEMIKQANLRLDELADNLSGTVTFDVDDITAINKPSNTYNKVIVTRVIINLMNWENQLQGLSECARVLKPGGMLLLSEATVQGWQQLNRFRQEWKLPDIPMPSFNLYLDQDLVIESTSSYLHLVEIKDFASTYYIGTRLLKPLLIQSLGVDIDVTDPNMEWNRWFSQLPSYGNYGTQKLFIFKKL